VSDDYCAQVSRRSLMRAGITILAAGLADQAAAQQEQPAKVDQKLVLYQPTPKNGQACVKCQHFEPPDMCKLVAGKISAAGWCQLFAAKPQ
jgi:High potential iron-sulfur protein